MPWLSYLMVSRSVSTWSKKGQCQTLLEGKSREYHAGFNRLTIAAYLVHGLILSPPRSPSITTCILPSSRQKQMSLRLVDTSFIWEIDQTWHISHPFPWSCLFPLFQVLKAIVALSQFSSRIEGVRFDDSKSSTAASLPGPQCTEVGCDRRWYLEHRRRNLRLGYGLCRFYKSDCGWSRIATWDRLDVLSCHRLESLMPR